MSGLTKTLMAALFAAAVIGGAGLFAVSSLTANTDAGRTVKETANMSQPMEVVTVTATRRAS